ncbi:MAG: hypothetical protein RRY10_05710, partial [Christensenellaceae bacterium]
MLCDICNSILCMLSHLYLMTYENPPFDFLLADRPISFYQTEDFFAKLKLFFHHLHSQRKSINKKLAIFRHSTLF